MPDIFIDTNKTNNEKSNGEIKKSHSSTNCPLKKFDKNQKKSSKSFLSAFYSYPVGVKFETQEDTEEIILLLRRHVVTNLLWIIISIILIFAPAAIFPFLNFLLPFSVPLNFQIVGIIIWYGLVGSFIFMNFLSWYFNVYIVTNERVVDVDFYNLTYKKIASAQLNRVQDVTIRSGGVIRTLFNFADVYIQTAGTEPNFVFEAVPNSDVVAREILELCENSK